MNRLKDEKTEKLIQVIRKLMLLYKQFSVFLKKLCIQPSDVIEAQNFQNNQFLFVVVNKPNFNQHQFFPSLNFIEKKSFELMLTIVF